MAGLRNKLIRQEPIDIIFRDKFGIFTHRCHKQEFLLKFSRDRRIWLHWLFEAKKRYGLQILNYVVTSNRIHLLIIDGDGDDDDDAEVVPKGLQLIAGKTAQEFHRRKNRKGAWWLQ